MIQHSLVTSRYIADVVLSPDQSINQLHQDELWLFFLCLIMLSWRLNALRQTSQVKLNPLRCTESSCLVKLRKLAKVLQHKSHRYSHGFPSTPDDIDATLKHNNLCLRNCVLGTMYKK